MQGNGLTDFIEKTKEANPESNNYNIYASAHFLFLAHFVLNVLFYFVSLQQKGNPEFLNSGISETLIFMGRILFP